MPLETAASVQLVVGENAPAPFEEKPTVPVGVLTVPALVSVTVALQELGTPVAMLGGLHSMVVVVVRVVTVRGLLPELLT